MVFPVAAKVYADFTLCGGCGAVLTAHEAIAGSDGHVLCAACNDDRQPLVELQIDHEMRHGHDVPAPGAPNISPSPAGSRQHPQQLMLLAQVICPHCLLSFAPQEVLWVARHADLLGDSVAGPDVPLRFLPNRFTVDGAAIDLRGMPCEALACPRCHLIIPRPLLEAESLFASIAGVSGSGKSCFLAAMTWHLRRLLPMHFSVAFHDVDLLFNHSLNRLEEDLFLAADAQCAVKLEQTGISGTAQYNQIRRGPQVFSLPRPLLFSLSPSGKHPNGPVARQSARVVCLYDIAGDHFSPGRNEPTAPVTHHLGMSQVLMFLFDPTLDPRFRARFGDLGVDAPMEDAGADGRQANVFQETVARVRQFGAIPEGQPFDRPILVIVPKADMWGKRVDLDLSTEPILLNCVAGGILAGVDLARIEKASAVVRAMLAESAPELIAAVEEVTANVIYIPISALGASPEVAPGKEGPWIRPENINPQWVTVPFLYMFARWSHDLIGGVRRTPGE